MTRRDLDWMKLLDEELEGREARRLKRELAGRPDEQQALDSARALGHELRSWVGNAAESADLDALWQRLDRAMDVAPASLVDEASDLAPLPSESSEAAPAASEAQRWSDLRRARRLPLPGESAAPEATRWRSRNGRGRKTGVRRWGFIAAVAVAAGWLVWQLPAPWRGGSHPVVQEAAAVELDEDSGIVFELPDPDGSGTMTVVWLESFRE